MLEAVPQIRRDPYRHHAECGGMSAIQYGADDVRKLRVPADAQSGHHRPGAACPPAGGIGYADELCRQCPCRSWAHQGRRGHGIRLSGPALGRPKKGETRDKAQDYRDECERVEVERRFSLAKRKCSMGLVTAKLRETAAHVIAMSVLVLNLRKIQRALLRMLAYLLEILAPKKNRALVQWILSKLTANKYTLPGWQGIFALLRKRQLQRRLSSLVLRGIIKEFWY